MNQTHSQTQVSNSENFPSSLVTTYSDSQDDNNFNVFPQSNLEQAFIANDFHETSQYGNIDRTQSVQSPQFIRAQTNHVHPTVFIYRTPNDFCQYRVNCKEISYDTVTYLLNKLREHNIQSNGNEFIFYYRQQYDARFYEVSCEIVSPLLINNCLNKNFFGVELQQNTEQEQLAFTFGQKENLEHYLKQYLSQYLLK
ncbi:hypothetical protein C1645_840537 [Glomus cerebriforme]|uniref:Uncharacterized protein n=1 Tax=Glomus cerebriforme TaxID=658196 RepID=A0A397S9V9_9GLOM|nr:hypothetical protein C1645_840537 [Glomus cerebriforme]